MYEDEVIDHLYSKRGRGVGKPKKVWPNWPDSDAKIPKNRRRKLGRYPLPGNRRSECLSMENCKCLFWYLEIAHLGLSNCPKMAAQHNGWDLRISDPVCCCLYTKKAHHIPSIGIFDALLPPPKALPTFKITFPSLFTVVKSLPISSLPIYLSSSVFFSLVKGVCAL